VVLSFGVADPVGAIGIQADVATCGALGCHTVCVITALLVGDTTVVEDVQPIDTDWILSRPCFRSNVTMKISCSRSASYWFRKRH